MPATHDAGFAGSEGLQASRKILEAQLGHTFRDPSLLARALTHSSATADKSRDNERLEFLGDAVLDLVVCEHFFHTYPTQREGELTEAKSRIVQGETLAAVARTMDLRPHVILGRGIANRKQLPSSVYANMFEALVAALYLDGGYGAARDFILERLGPQFDESRDETDNHKSRLQEYVQQDAAAIPVYRVTAERGPGHRKTFEVAVHIHGKAYGRGTGLSKKEAEQNAAREALMALGADPPPPTAPGACPDSADPDTARSPDATAPESRTERAGD